MHAALCRSRLPGLSHGTAFWHAAQPSTTIAEDGCSMSARPPKKDAVMRHGDVYKPVFAHHIAVQHLLRFVAGMTDDGPEWLTAFDA